VPAAVRAFLASDSFEDAVRRAVAFGGDSDTIASMAGAIAAPFYGGVPEKIAGLCNVYLDGQLRSLMESFENTFLLKKASRPIKVEHKRDDSFKVIKAGDVRYFVVPSYRTDMIDALKARFGDDITLVKPSEMSGLLKTLSVQDKDGTYLENPRPDVRTIYFQDGEFRTSATMTGGNLPSRKDREDSRREFLNIHDYALEVKHKLQRACGYDGSGSIHFAAKVLGLVVTLRHSVRIECVCLDNIGTGNKILLVYSLNNFGTCEHQQVVVSFEQHRMRRKKLAAEILLNKIVTLYHCAHRSVEHQNPIL
jgi:hypothetical protein